MPLVCVSCARFKPKTFFVWSLIGGLILTILRFFVDKLVIPSEKLSSEIQVDRNVGAAILVGGIRCVTPDPQLFGGGILLLLSQPHNQNPHTLCACRLVSSSPSPSYVSWVVRCRGPVSGLRCSSTHSCRTVARCKMLLISRTRFFVCCQVRIIDSSRNLHFFCA